MNATMLTEPRSRFYRLATAIFAMSISCAAGAQDPTSSSQTPASRVALPPDVVQNLEKIPDPGPPAARLRLLKMNIESGSHVAESEWRYEQPGAATLGVLWLIPGKGGKGILRQMLTLRGLVELASAVDMAFDYKTPVVIPFGQVFLPFAINSSFKANAVRNTKSLDGDLAPIGAITPGAKFSYVHAFDIRMTTSGMFGGTRTTSHEFALSCNAGEAQSAASLHPKARGMFLPITCEGTNNQQQALRHEHAYLVESKLYIPVSTTIDGRRDSYKITDVEYID